MCSDTLSQDEVSTEHRVRASGRQRCAPVISSLLSASSLGTAETLSAQGIAERLPELMQDVLPVSTQHMDSDEAVGGTECGVLVLDIV